MIGSGCSPQISDDNCSGPAGCSNCVCYSLRTLDAAEGMNSDARSLSSKIETCRASDSRASTRYQNDLAGETFVFDAHWRLSLHAPPGCRQSECSILVVYRLRDNAGGRKVHIKPERLIADLRELARFGKYKTGVNRPAFSKEDIAARFWLAKKMSEAGLEPGIDKYGTVIGRNSKVAKAILVGSHSDTVPNGGWLDGSLGVIYGLEIARCFAETGATGVGVDAISFQDEEGTFLALMGSRAFCSEDIAAEVAAAKDKSGAALTAAIAKSGFGAGNTVRLEPNRHIAYLESHIEQGPRLERAGQRIGVVSAIVGIKTFRFRFLGQADHAGTTPMTMRHDAGAAALQFGVKVSELMKAAAGPDTVWNVGSMVFKPGASNVVPNEVELVFQFRDTSPGGMDAVEGRIRLCAEDCATASNATVEITRTLDTRPTAMAPDLIGTLNQAAAEFGEKPMSLPSGAGHDAMVMARYVPSAMLFVPSIGGRSHDIVEDTKKEDIIRGAEVLLRATEIVAASL